MLWANLIGNSAMNLARRSFLAGLASTALMPALLNSASAQVLGAPQASWNVARISAAICAMLEEDHDGVIYDWTWEELKSRQLRTNPKENWSWNGKGAVLIV